MTMAGDGMMMIMMTNTNDDDYDDDDDGYLARNLLRFSTLITFDRGASCSHGCSRHLDHQDGHRWCK